MTNSTKYGRITTSEKDIPSEEPVFLLRGQDTFAAPAVVAYANFLQEEGYGEEIVNSIHQQAERMRQWPVKKNPD